MSYNVDLSNAIVARAWYWYETGATYVWGGCSAGYFDCSGFVSYCVTGSYSRIGTASTFYSWSSVSDPQPGDIVCTTSHCGIYVGGGMMIHAAGSGKGIRYSAVQSGMKYVRYYG